MSKKIVSKKKILLIGWYGHSNLGDDLLLKTITNFLKPLTYKLYYTSPKKTIHSGKNIKLSSKNNFFKFLGFIFKADLIVYGGGTYLRDNLNKKQLKIKLFAILFAILLKKKIVFFGTGLGPFSFNKKSLLLKFVLIKVLFPSFRDEDSLNLYNKITDKNGILVPDPVFLLTKDKKIQDFNKKNIIKEKKNSKQTVAFALREWHDKNSTINRSLYFDNMVSIVSKFIHQNANKFFFKFFVFQDDKKDNLGNDNNVYKKIKIPAGLKIQTIYLDSNIDNLCKIYDKIDIIVGMRLHSLILGCIFNKKLLAISYDPKVKSFFKELCLEKYCQDFTKFSLAKLNQLVKEVEVQSYQTKKKELLKNLDNYKKISYI